jgi:uncharacterized protein YaiI (UPF0178 family)
MCFSNLQFEIIFIGEIMMKIYVDADACPVKDIIISEGTKAETPVILVTSFSHFSTAEQPSGVETIYVDSGADAADYRIMKLAQKGDIIITQDYGLASLGLAKGCTVLHHTGYSYTNENIDQLLQTRYLSAMARKSGKRTKGPKPFTAEDRENFRMHFKRAISC